MDVAAIVLAGGRSRRFGSDKLLYQVNGKPMILHVIDEALRITRKVYVITRPGEDVKIRGLVGDAELLLDDELLRCSGSARGIATGLNAINADYYVILPGDSPWVKASALRSMLDLTALSGALVAPLVEPGVASPLYLAMPRSLRTFLVDLCDSLSLITSRPSNYLRASRSLLVGSGLLTSSSIVFKDVDRPSDLTTSSAQPLIRSVIELRRPDLFIAAVKAYSRGLAEEAYEFLAKEAKLYRSLGVHSLELAAMVDMLVVGRKAKDRELREVEARVAELRALMGRSPKVPQPKVS